MPREEFEKWFYEEQSLITSEQKQAMLAQSQTQRPGKRVLVLTWMMIFADLMIISFGYMIS